MIRRFVVAAIFLLLVTPRLALATPQLPYYLSLGDSLARGVQPLPNGTLVETIQGYTDDVYGALRFKHPLLQHKKLGCSGETTTTMLTGGVCQYPAGNQVDQAVAFIAMLAALDTTGTDTEHIDELTALEALKSAISARQARITDAFATSHRAKLIKAGSTPADARRSVCAQIALARRDSPSKGNRHVGLAHTLVHEMPLVLRALEHGHGSEWRATLIARETAHLSTEHHAEIDAVEDRYRLR